MSAALLSAIVVQADDAPRHTGPDFGKASPMGLLVIVLLLLATVFLIRSMNRQLKKVPESFDRENPELHQAADEGGDRIAGAAECSGPAPERDVEQSMDRDRPPHEPDG
jgi:hypothetical protein